MSARIAICLFEDSITDFDANNLLTGQPLNKLNVVGRPKGASLYLKVSSESTPEWANVIQGFSNLNIKDTTTASSGAILFLKIKKRVVACCFGSVVGNINRENIENDFGLAVAFWRINKQNYKGIETFTLTENPITNHRSAAMPATKNNFNLDAYLENITELSGKYYTKSKSVLVKGKEFFSMPAPLTLDKIEELCSELVDDYEKAIGDTSYKALTAVSKIKAKKLIDYLNNELCAHLNKRLSDIYLLDYSHISGITNYSLTPKGQKLSEIEIATIYDELKKGQKFSVNYLKSRKITVYDNGAQMLDEWPLYKCLFINLKLNIGGHILYKGHWYEVQKRYLDDLKSFLKPYEVDASTLGLPRWDRKANEGDYNVSASNVVGGQCWDKNLYTNPEFNHGIEFCDVLLSDHIIHVKKLTSSALNSHLLMQTYVSAQLLKTDPGIRFWIKNKSSQLFRKNILLNRSNEVKQNPVTYVIALMAGTTKLVSDSLPFFSLVTFNMVIRRLDQLGYQVKICIV